MGALRLPLGNLRRLPFMRRHIPDIVLEGERIWLRPLVVEDAEAFYKYASDAEVTRYLPWYPASSVDSVRPFLAEEMWRGRRGDSLRLAIVWRETGTVIGSTDIVDLRKKEKKGMAELGYLLAREYWGMGLMTEAAGLTIRHAFDTMHLRELIAYADCENKASVRVLEKIGMQLTSTDERIVKGETRRYARYSVKNTN